MRNSFLIVSIVSLALSATVVRAQQPNLFMSEKDITALVDKAKADRKGDQPMVPEPILQLAPYRAQLEYRPITAPAAVHEKDAELMVVLSGTGTIVTGGKLVEEKRVNSANLTGSSIAEGSSQAVVKGDMIMVPANSPHQVIPTGGAPIVLMTMHIPFPPANWPPAN